MKFHVSIVACFAIFYALVMIASPRATTISAAPRVQATGVPTEEPTKRPYVFPTPIFIPTYADDTPAPRSTPVAPVQPGTDTYTVQSGDSPWIIAQKVYGDGTKYKLIMEANGLTDQTRLRVGTVLRIPSIGGNPAPPPVPTQTSTPAINTPVSVAGQPTIALPTAASIPTIARTSTPQLIPTSTAFVDALPTIINVASAILLIAAIAAGGLSYLLFLRGRRMAQLDSGKHPIRIKQ